MEIISLEFLFIIGVCFGLVFLMIILLSVLQCRRMAQLRQAIAEESARYSSRSTPCSWRLETTTFYTGNFENRKTETTYHVNQFTFLKFLFKFDVRVLDYYRYWPRTKCLCSSIISSITESNL